jgi:hypothetical protein
MSSLYVSAGVRVRRAVDHGFEGGAQFAYDSHILAFESKIGRMHLDKLPDENPRAGVVLAFESLSIGQGGSNEVIHELKFTAQRDAKPGKLDLLRGVWF